MLMCPVLLIGLDVARHIHWMKHRDLGFVPSTQHWVMVTCLISILCGLSGLILFIIGKFGS